MTKNKIKKLIKLFFAQNLKFECYFCKLFFLDSVLASNFGVNELRMPQIVGKFTPIYIKNKETSQCDDSCLLKKIFFLKFEGIKTNWNQSGKLESIRKVFFKMLAK